jgi:ATP-binding cassette subfamily B protein
MVGGHAWAAERQHMARAAESVRQVWRASPGWMLVSIGVVLLQSVFPALLLYVLKLIIDVVGRAMASGGEAADFTQAAWLIGLAATIAVVEMALRSISGLVSEAQGQAVSDYVHELLVAKSVEVELAYYENPEYYDTLHRAQQEAPRRTLHLAASLNQVVRSGATLLGMLVLLLTFHWVIVLLLIGCAVPSVLIRARFGRALHRWHDSRTALDRQAGYLASLLTTVEPAKEVRLFGLGRVLIDRFRATRALLRHERLAIVRRRALIEIVTQVSAELVVFGSLGLLAFEAMQGTVSLGGLVVYFWALQYGRALLNETLSGLVSIYEDTLFLSSLHDFLSLELRVPEPERPVPVPRPWVSGITVQGVSFWYLGSEAPALDDISLAIRPGEKVALVGENGSGKTTLVKLLCRLYDPSAGEIRLDGIPLWAFETAALRREIGVVFQDYMRYELTARENIWVGNVERSLDAAPVEAAAASTGAHEVIARLPEGYDTQLGKHFEGGAELSLGEWQKVALARAFLRDSQLVILDEPTSALDAAAEYEVFQRFARLAEGRTAILISHRLSTVRMADRIYVLDRGRLVESGTHDELMQRRAKYAQLFDLQAQAYR